MRSTVTDQGQVTLPRAIRDRLGICPADFVDCLLATKAKARGCEALRSFDKKMKVLPGVVLL